MVLPFEIIKILKYIIQEPAVLVAFAAFHPIVLLLLFIPLGIFKKIGIYTPNENLGLFGISVTIIIAVGWILGFVSQILFLFMGFAGLKMIFIYVSMYLCIVAFVVFNAKGLHKKFLRETNTLANKKNAK